MIKVLSSLIIDLIHIQGKSQLYSLLPSTIGQKRSFFSNYQHFVFFYYQFNRHFRDLSCTLCWEQLDKRDHFSAITQINTSSRLPLSHISFIQLSTLLLLKSSHIFPHEKLLANVFSNSTLLLNLVIFSLIPHEK